MKNLIWGLFAFATLAHAQGTVTDIDGNTYDYLTYGTQQWTVDNAAMETYRDGTPIPQVTDATQWSNLTTGAWCYYDNDPAKGKLYNWYAVAGIHDNDPNTPNKEFAPEGWHVPTDAEWTTLEEHLIANAYNYDGTTTGNKIAKSIASTTGWNISTYTGAIGNDQSLNNSSGFNAFPEGSLYDGGSFFFDHDNAFFWSSTEGDSNNAWSRVLSTNTSNLFRSNYNKDYGFSVRFIQNSNTCSEVSINASATEVCAGESVDLSVDGLNSSSGVNTQSHSFTTGNYTRIPYTPHLYNLPQSTIEFWYYQESSSEEFIVATEYFNTGWGFHVENNGGSSRILEWRVSNGVKLGFDIPDRYEIPFNQWIHVAGVHDGSTVYLYVDGNLIDSASYTGQIGDSYEDIVINRHTWASGSSERLNGKIDELRISNIARYTSNFTPPLYEFNNDSNTLALWHFNGNMQDESQYNTQSVTNGTNFSSNVPFGSYNFNSTDLFWSTGDTTETISVTPTETTEYWVDVTTNGVTCREYATINVTAPSAPTGDAEQTFCDTATIADLTATGENIQWYDASTGGNLLDSTTALTDGQMVYASQTVNGCESTDRLEVTVSIQDITITASATEVCAGESVDLTVSSGLTTDSTTGFTANLQNGLVAYWPFSGNANDESGNGNNGTVNGATLTTDRFGNVNSAYSFDGNNDNIDLSSTFSLNESNVLTFSFWTEMGGNNRSYLIDLAQPATNRIAIIFNNNGDNFEVGFNDDLNLRYLFPLSSGLVEGQWVNFIIIIDYFQNNLKIFKNSELLGSTQISASIPFNTFEQGGAYKIGSRYDDSNFANIIIDDIAIWNRALSETEVQQLAGAPSYTWSTGDTTETISVTPAETTEYWVDVTTNGVTCREYVTINVTAPSAPTGDAEQTFCTSSTVADLTATGDNIQWYDASTGGNLLDSTTVLTDGQMVYASQTVNGCESTDRLEVTVSIQDITITASATEVCAGESVDLTVSSGLTTDSTTGFTANLQNGLVAYWPFSGNANDESGNGNNGTVNGATLTTDRFGNTDSAYYFSSAGCATRIDADIPQLQDNQNGFTISFWVMRTGNGCINPRLWELWGGSKTQQCKWVNGASFLGSDGLNTVNTTLNDDIWYNICFTTDGITQKVFVNGSFNNSQPVQTSHSNNGIVNSTDFAMGRMNHPAWDAFNGKLDDFALWNRALSETEVQQLAGAPSYNWSTGDTTENITVTPTETTEYWVDVTTNGVTCREYVTIDVTTPSAPTGNPVLGGCSGSTVASSNSDDFIGENLQWYAAPSGGPALPESHPLVDGTYYYISQTVDGCESSDRFEFLYLAPEPTITIESPTICEGDSTTVSVSSSPSLGTATFLWNTGETSDSVTLSPTESTTFWVDQIYNSGAPENIQTVCRYFFGITVDSAPEAPDSGGDISECETIAAQSLVATASAEAGESITWYDAATGGSIVADPSLSAAGTVTYYAEATNDTSGCASLTRTAVTLTITSVAAPTGDAVQSFCDNVTVSDLSASGSNIQWYDAATGGNVLDPSSALSDGQFLYASQTENSCESVTRLEVSVEIDIIPDPILITTELEFCLAREATLADLEVDEQGFALEWYDSFSGGNMLPMDTLLEDGVSYYATLYDAASGCESLMRLEVVPTVIPCEVVIYNAISLNDNGINDHMVIENAEYFPDNSLEVYNRDGHLLYSQTQYGIGDNLFRGVANVSGIYGSTLSGDGPRLPTGSYLYVFKYFNPYEQQQYTLKGFLTINSN